METLVVPLKFNNIALINAYNNVVCDSAVYPIPIILSILKFAAQLRAKFKVSNAGCDSSCYSDRLWV